MKRKLLNVLTAIIMLLIPTMNYAQAPPLGTAANFVLFSTDGAVKNMGTLYETHLTGNVGTNNGSSTGFGNVNGGMHDGDGVSAQCAADLLIAYNQLNSTVPTFFPASLLGNGQMLNAGVYSIAAAATLNSELILNGQGNANAVFIFQIQGSLSTSAFSRVKLINGALACNVFWKVEGLVDMATGTSMKGTVIANNAAINMAVGDTLEGRALSTAGAVTVTGVLAYTPVGCGSLTLTGPAAPVFVASKDYAIFSSNGPVSNTGVTKITGDVGTNVGLTTGFNALDVTGTIHAIPDGSTAGAAADLLNVYNGLNALTADIELLHPDLFGHNLVLTPHTYLMNGAVTFTDTLYLDAMGNANAVFIIKTYGAFSSNVGSRVVLINGALSKNVYWMVNGAVSIGDNSIFNGTIVANNGAIDLLSGATLLGRALTTDGALATASMTTLIPFSPLVTTDPTNQIICAGGSASFTVVASGTSITYQWRKGSINLINGGNISGANSASLTINPVSIADASVNYNVIVTGAFAPNDTSNNASLTVNTAPSITTQPANESTCLGDAAIFSVISTGSGLTYQWRKGVVNLTDGGSISGATTSILTINPVIITDVAANYNVVISGTCAPSATSANASLAVGSAISITSEPANQTVCSGSSATFSVVAKGGGLTYQWRKGIVNLVNGGSISGATSASLTINPVVLADVAANYNVVISSTCAANDTSINASLTMNTAPSITTEPIDVTICTGSSASFSVIAAGSGLTYQWRKGVVNLTNGGSVSGATTATLTINPVIITDVAANYNVVISGTCAPNATSINALLTMNTAPSITTEPIDKAVCAGSSASFSVIAAGSGLTYQWRKGVVNLTNGGAISGATSATLIINPVNIADEAADYNVVVSGTCLPNSTSANVALVVNTSAIITNEPADQTACVGSSISFTTLATGSSLSYQWRKGVVNLTNVGNISGATSATLTINPVSISDAGINYNVIVTGACASADTSVNAVLVANSALGITTEPMSQTVCQGSSASFSVVSAGIGLSYQWRKGIVNLTNGATISGATSATLTINPVTVSDVDANYNVIVTGACATNDTSINVALASVLAPTITTEPVNQTACSGSIVNVSVLATGSGLSYQWRKGNINIINDGNVSGATSATLVMNPVSISNVALNYNVIVSSACSSDTSNSISLVINNAPEITSVPLTQTVCNGSLATFAVTATGSGLTYQWKKGSVNLTNAGNISGATSSSLTINPVSIADEAANYHVTITGTCAPNNSTNVALIVNTAPKITSEPTNAIVCLDGSVSYSVTATGAGLSYQWRKGIDNLTNTGNISGATSAKLVIDPANNSNAAVNYNVVVMGTCSQNATSQNVSLEVNALSSTPNVVTGPVSQVMCPGCPVKFSVVATGTFLTYQWRKGTVNLTNGGNIFGATSDSLTIVTMGVSDTASNYNVVVTGTCSQSVVKSASLSLCTQTGIGSFNANIANNVVTIYPNPFTSLLNIVIADDSKINSFNLKVFDILGVEVMNTIVTKQVSNIKTTNIPSGVYFYKVIGGNKVIQSGKLISIQ
jgi:hypothetical protein